MIKGGHQFCVCSTHKNKIRQLPAQCGSPDVQAQLLLKLMKENLELQTSLGYTVEHCLQAQNKTKIRE